MGHKQCKKQWEPRSAPQIWQRWKPTFYRCLEMIEMKCYTKKKKPGSSVKICILNDSPHPTPLFTLQVPLLCSGPTKLAAAWISSGSRLEVSGETGPKKRCAHINMWVFPKLKKKFSVFLTCIEISCAWDPPNQIQALISSSASLLTCELAKDDQRPEEISDMKKWLKQTNKRTK